METRQEVTNPPFKFEPDDLGLGSASHTVRNPVDQGSPKVEVKDSIAQTPVSSVSHASVLNSAITDSAITDSVLTIKQSQTVDGAGTVAGSDDDRHMANLVAKQLMLELGEETFELWFSTKNAIQCDSQQHRLTFVAEHEFALNRLQTTFGQTIRKISSLVCGPQYSVGYEIGTVEKTTATMTASTNGGNKEGRNSDSGSNESNSQAKKPNHRPAGRTLRSFWFGADNQLLQAAVDHLQREPGQFSPLMIHGAAGCGKTHLLEAIVADTRRRGRNKRCVYLTSEQFTTYFIQSLRGSGLPMFRRKYRDLDVLAIDDVQFFAKKKATLAEFQFTIDNLTRSGKQIILASDCPPFELENFQDELTARMSSGLVCQLKYPDEQGRVAIARRMCAERSLSLPTSVIELVANRLTKDVRRISGAINRLHALKVATEQKITDQLAEEVLSDLFAIASSNSSMVKIEKAVCEMCGVKSSELKSPSRKKRISTARMLAMYLSRKYTSSAFSEIGDHFGGRSHSTVIAAERKVDRLIKDDQQIELPNAAYPVREVISRIESKLRVG